MLRKKYLQPMQNNYFFKVKKQSFPVKKRQRLKDREEKVKRETEKLFYEPIIVSKDNMEKLKEQEMKKIKQSVMGKKPKMIR